MSNFDEDQVVRVIHGEIQWSRGHAVARELDEGDQGLHVREIEPEPPAGENISIFEQDAIIHEQRHRPIEEEVEETPRRAVWTREARHEHVRV